MPEEAPVVETNEAPATTLEEQVKTEDGSEPAKTAGEETDEKPRGGFQRKIDKLTREKHELKGVNDELRRRLDGIEQRLGTQPDKKTAEDPRPVVDNFKDWDEYQEALIDWKVRQKLTTAEAERERQAAKQSEADTLKEIHETYLERSGKFMAEHDDFNEVVGQIRLPKAVGEAVQLAVMEDELGPELAYYLGMHPEVQKKLADMTPARAVIELGRIASRLEPEPAAEEEPAPEKPAVSAPAPIRPVRKPSVTDTGLSDDLDIKKWMARREKQLGS